MPGSIAALTGGGFAAVTRNLAIEEASGGIRVTAVGPGVTETPTNPPEGPGFAWDLNPVGRPGEAAEVADAVLYLERAGRIAGDTLDIDGGQRARRW